MKSTRRIGRARAPHLLLPALVVLLAATGCERGSPRPDVLLVTIDTLRSDHCSAYGYPVATTPTLERLAADGVLYRRAYAESATTSPSHAVLMTGRHFRTFGLTKNGGTLPDDVVTLAEALRDAGYETAGFVSSLPLKSQFGFNQGFDNYDDTFDPADASVGRRKPGKKAHDRIAGATVASVERWLDRRKNTRPMFVWVHFVDPHSPYRPPEEFALEPPIEARAPRRIKAIRRYDGEIRYADKQLGRLVEKLAARDEDAGPVRRLFDRLTGGRSHDGRIIAVTSDHGEGLGDHAWMTHGVNLYEEAVRVPLVVQWKGHLPAGKVVEAPVGIVDIAPSILALLEIDAKTFAHGRNLFGPEDSTRTIYLQRRDYRSGQERGRRIGGGMSAIVEGGNKFIVAPLEERRELYDLVADPRESRNLLEAEPGPSPAAGSGSTAPAPAESAKEEAARKLEDKLYGWQRDFPAAEKSETPLDKETLRALRSLGYVD